MGDVLTVHLSAMIVLHALTQVPPGSVMHVGQNSTCSVLTLSNVCQRSMDVKWTLLISLIF